MFCLKYWSFLQPGPIARNAHSRTREIDGVQVFNDFRLRLIRVSQAIIAILLLGWNMTP